jgi:hypothetical protein
VWRASGARRARRRRGLIPGDYHVAVDFSSIALAAACMIGMCVVGMWLMTRFMHRDHRDDE